MSENGALRTLTLTWCIISLSCDAVDLLVSLQKQAFDVLLKEEAKYEAEYGLGFRWWIADNMSTKFMKVALSHMKHVAGDATWLKTNPGQQDSLLTGSFHPMSRCATC